MRDQLGSRPLSLATSASSTMAKSIGPELERYLLQNVRPTGSTLGAGAYGTVEEVIVPGAICAAKSIHESLLTLSAPDALKNILDKFAVECQLMSSLRHPRVVQFMGICFLPSSNSKVPALVMERLAASLDALLEKYPNIPLAMKISILLDVTWGLDYLHQHSPPIIHRDLTAKNILLNLAMEAKIADLGVARILDPDQLSQTLTRVPGTAVYMPPEAFEPRPVYDAKIDIFSFGNLALYTFTQVFPELKAPTYLSSDGQLFLRTEVERREEQMEMLYTQLGRAHSLVQMVEQCLHNDPHKRPSVHQLLQYLQQAKANINDPYVQMTKLEVMQVLSEKESQICELQEQVTKLQSQPQVSV